ncbi:hypothetical protein SLA2020_338920 [Shorea laevis]
MCFALAASDPLKDLQDNSFKYMAEFIKEYSREARIRQASAAQGGSITDYPAYIVVFLIYLLAHDTGFPHENCQDEELYAQFCSPLFHLLEALKAEDVVDAQNTAKLHILADIGFSFVTALNHNGVPSSHAPALILLPSAFISRCLTRSSFDDCFLEKIIHMFKSRISLPVSSLPKRGRKCQEDDTQSEIIKNNTVNWHMASNLICPQLEQESKKMRARMLVWDIGENGQSLLLLLVQLDCVSVYYDHRHGASKKSEKNLEKELLSSSCDSVSLRPSLAESHLSTQILERNAPSFKENLRDSGSIIAEPSNYLRAKLKDPYNITYDSEEVEVLCLETESCETTSNGPLVEREVVLSDESNTFQLQCSSLKKAVDAIGDVATQQQKVSPFEESKAKKGRKAALDTSASEVVNLNENAVSLTALYLFILILYYRNQCPNHVLKADSSHNLTF